MLEIDNTKQQLEYLSNQINSMYVVGVDSRKLGKLAIQVLMMRVNLENVLEEKKYSKEDKKKAKKMQAKVKEIERRVVSLFLMSRIARAKTPDTLGSFFDYIRGSYEYEEAVE